MKFIANLTDQIDLDNSDGPSSFGTGNYFFELHAENMDEAQIKGIERAHRDGFYGFGWHAKIVKLKAGGHYDPGFFGSNERCIKLA